jgi:hypothetical protein
VTGTQKQVALTLQQIYGFFGFCLERDFLVFVVDEYEPPRTLPSPSLPAPC